MNQRSDAPSATLGRQELIRELEQLAANDGMTHQHAAHVHLHVKLIKPIVEALRSERAPSGMAMLAELSPTRLEAKLESLRANAVMSKFATVRECQAYRHAVEDVLEMVRVSHPLVDGDLDVQRAIADTYASPSATREKLLAKACDAAFAFIDSHVADPDLTDEMVRKHAEYLEARRALEGTP